MKIAVLYGADAVYIGGEAYGLRAKAKNFDIDTMKEGIDFAMNTELKYILRQIYSPIIPILTEWMNILRKYMK